MNQHKAELEKFDAIAPRWWDEEGPVRTLHQINPLRLAFINKFVDVTGKRVIDIGCGGGILTEALARSGADVTGLDLAPTLVDTAKLHQYESNLQINYLAESAEAHATQHPLKYDAVTCMEMLEHVPNPESIVLAASRLLQPGGFFFCSTLDRTPSSFLKTIIGAEYILQLLPKGTHDYRQMIRPAELAAMGRTCLLTPMGSAGIHYHPLTQRFTLDECMDANYLFCFQKD